MLDYIFSRSRRQQGVQGDQGSARNTLRNANAPVGAVSRYRVALDNTAQARRALKVASNPSCLRETHLDFPWDRPDSAATDTQ